METNIRKFEESKKSGGHQTKGSWTKFFTNMGIPEKEEEEVNQVPVPNGKNTMWVPDEKGKICYNCHKQFSSIFIRKHHCRICGNVFCKDCSSYNVSGKYWGSKKEIKVCEYCFEMYKKLDETLVETIIDNQHNYIENIDSIDDNIKNLRRDTKLSEYCKKYKKEIEECCKFLESDKKSEEIVKQNLENCYDQLLKNIIEVVLKSENLYEKWFDKLYELIKKTVSQVNPSFKELKDSLNINDYVKIKTIPYKDQSLCKLIDGFAFQKNVTSKIMKTNIDNPKLLLLDCGLDYNRNPNNITNFENLMTLEPSYFSIIMKKIELVEPTVILVSKNVSRKIQEALSISNKVSIVINVKSKSLKKIARCTKTYVLPSTDLIDKQTILGSCKKFKIEKIKTPKYFYMNDIIRANEYNLMTFEGCDNVLHATIIISGPDENELRVVKKLIRTILLIARDIYLQKHFLYFSNCDFLEVNEIMKENEIDSRISIASSKLTGTSISNNTISQSQRISIFNSKPMSIMNTTLTILIENLLYESNPSIREFVSGFDICVYYEIARVFNVTMLTMAIGTSTQSGFDKLLYNLPIDLISNNGPPGHFLNNVNSQEDESEILKRINTICQETQELELIFYSDKEQYDKPLGKLIIDLCNEADIRCECCKKMKFSHIYYIYKKQGRLKIEMIQNTSDPVDNVEKIMECINRESTLFSKYNNFSRIEKNNYTKENINYNMDIFSYGVCKICQKIVTPLVKLSREIYNFSASLFFKFMLFNHSLRNRSDKREFNLTKQYVAYNECNHFVNKDINRIFVTKDGIVKFSYEDSTIYIIDISPMYEKIDKLQNNMIQEAYLTNGRVRSLEIIDYLKFNFRLLSDNVESTSSFLATDIINSTLGNSQLILKGNIEKINKIITKYLNICNDIFTFVDIIFSSPSKFQNYNKAIVFIKKIYFRIVQVKIVFTKISKIVKKLQSILNDLIKSKSLIDKETNNSLTHSSNYVMSPTSLINSPNLDFEINPSTYINIDNKDTYKTILKEINFIDENHSKYSSDNSIDDLSSIICYTLTSDKYREFISPGNKFKLSEIKCERKCKSQFDYKDYIKESMKKEIKEMVEVQQRSNNKGMDTNDNSPNDRSTNDNKYGFNIFTTQDEEVYDTSLLFDPGKNKYVYQNLDTHKIYQQLETELLSDEKVHFTYTISNSSIMNNLTSWNLPVEFLKKKTENNIEGNSNTPVNTISNQNYNIKLGREKSNSDTAISQHSIIINNNLNNNLNDHTEIHTEKFNNTLESITQDEKIVLNGDNIKITFEEFEIIKNDLNSLKDKSSLSDAKTKYKVKKSESVEESILTPLEYEIIAYFPRQFEALRITYCTTYEEFILSISKSASWSNVTGGKSQAHFYKSQDNKFILKYVNKHEFKMFIETGFQYFHHNAKFLFHKMPSALMKILGAYKIKIKSEFQKIQASYVLLMENLFYGKDEDSNLKNIKSYDLKGSRLNRYIPKKDQKPNQVLPDTNFKEDFKGEPIVLEKTIAELLKAAVHNDSLILSKMNVVDYSLLIIIDDHGLIDSQSNNSFHCNINDHPSGCPQCNIKSIRVGIIDYVRKYTWDKQLEHVGKTIINRLQVPTIVNPVNYKERFKEAMAEYFIGI